MKIVQLKGPDRVRKRPVIFFNSQDIHGVECAVQSILEIYAIEAYLGRCSHVEVCQKGSRMQISGDDRGICPGEDAYDDVAWKNLFCQIFTDDPFVPDESICAIGLFDAAHYMLYGVPVQTSPDILCRYALCAVQSASEYMQVQVRRDGCETTLNFKKGYLLKDGITHISTDKPSGTRFTFAMDQEVFGQGQVTVGQVFWEDILQRLAMLVPGLRCTYRNEDAGTEQAFIYPGGAAEYVRQQPEMPVYNQRLEAIWKERYNGPNYTGVMVLAISPAMDAGNARYLHNFKYLRYGGAHIQTLQARICDAFSMSFAKYMKEKAQGDNRDFTFEELGRHLNIVLATWCAPRCSRWENNFLANRMFADMVYDVTGEELRSFCFDNKEQLRPVIDRIIADRK